MMSLSNACYFPKYPHSSSLYPANSWFNQNNSIFLPISNIAGVGMEYGCANERLSFVDEVYDGRKMAFLFLGKLLEKELFPSSDAYQRLREIKNLKDNWNDNGAKEFSDALIDRVAIILGNVSEEPFVCPTACGSIQLEYEKEDGSYLEFEVYEKRIEVYMVDCKGKEDELILSGKAANSRLYQMVVDFYA